MVEGTLTADLICDREITITVQGGYAADYTAVVSATRLRGNMVISKGKAAVRNLVLSPR